MTPSNLLTMIGTFENVAFTGVADGFGDPTETVTTADYPCWIAQRQRSEITDNANTQSETFDLYVDKSADGFVQAAGRVTINGVLYQIEGPPWTATNPRTGEISHLECFATRTV